MRIKPHSVPYSPQVLHFCLKIRSSHRYSGGYTKILPISNLHSHHTPIANQHAQTQHLDLLLMCVCVNRWVEELAIGMWISTWYIVNDEPVYTLFSQGYLSDFSVYQVS